MQDGRVVVVVVVACSAVPYLTYLLSIICGRRPGLVLGICFACDAGLFTIQGSRSHSGEASKAMGTSQGALQVARGLAGLMNAGIQ